MQRSGTTFFRNQGTLYRGKFYHAEIYGTVTALRDAICLRQPDDIIFVLLDIQEAVRALQTGNLSSCLQIKRVLHEVAGRNNVKVKWMPGDSKIGGKEEAEKAARSTLGSLPAQ